MSLAVNGGMPQKSGRDSQNGNEDCAGFLLPPPRKNNAATEAAITTARRSAVDFVFVGSLRLRAQSFIWARSSRRERSTRVTPWRTRPSGTGRRIDEYAARPTLVGAFTSAINPYRAGFTVLHLE